MSAAKLITCVAIGWVLGQVLWEFLLIAAEWAGRAVVRGVAAIFRLAVQQRKASPIVLPEEAKT
jgi:hypothetical protein